MIGSTPRMRGISKSDATTNKSFRFNPAYAGNILMHSHLMHIDQVQPRVCGEYSCVMLPV